MALTTVQKATTIESLSSLSSLQPHENSKSKKIDPNKILAKIFSYLSIKDSRQCSQVCRQWKQVADSDAVWRSHINFTLDAALIPHYEGQTYKGVIEKGMIQSSQIREKYQSFLNAKHPPGKHFVVVNLAARFAHILRADSERKIDYGFKREIVYIHDQNLKHPVQIELKVSDLLYAQTKDAKSVKVTKESTSLLSRFKKCLHLNSDKK